MANLCIKTPSSTILVLIFQLLFLRPRPSGESSRGVKSGVACQLKVREVAVKDAKGKRWDGGEEDTEEHQVDLVDKLLAGDPTVELKPEHRQDKDGIFAERVEDKARRSNIAPMSMNKNQPRSKL